MNILIYFILGIVFIDIILPLIEGITSLICTKFEVYKAKMAVDINKYNMEIENESLSTQDSISPIGFMYEPEEVEEEEIIDD